MVDNGYLKWSVTIPPHKNPEFQTEVRFSEWIESMRKDVECTFGILKGRWKCLKYGIRLHGIESCDKIWLTCCALHNMLLEVDGLAERWDKGEKSYWETELDTVETLPFALKRLARSCGTGNFDISGMGHGNDVVPTFEYDTDNPSPDDPLYDGSTSTCVKDMSFDVFRDKLVRHFNIAFHLKEIKWPRRIKK